MASNNIKQKSNSAFFYAILAITKLNLLKVAPIEELRKALSKESGLAGSSILELSICRWTSTETSLLFKNR